MIQMSHDDFWSLHPDYRDIVRGQKIAMTYCPLSQAYRWDRVQIVPKREEDAPIWPPQPSVSHNTSTSRIA